MQPACSSEGLTHHAADLIQDLLVGHGTLVAVIVALPQEAQLVAAALGDPAVQAVVGDIGAPALEPLAGDGAFAGVEVEGVVLVLPLRAGRRGAFRQA